MSQQQYPHAASQSALQELGSEKSKTDANAKPFSIRQCALACRQRNIVHSWPFPEKYLHMSLNHGLRDVLPPFESLKGCSNLMHSRHDSEDADFCRTEVSHLLKNPQNIENIECGLLSDGGRYKVTNHTRECPSSHEEGDKHNCNLSVNVADTFTQPSSFHVHKSSPTLASSKAKKNKRTRDRRRCKKRSVKDILAVAPYRTLEQAYIYL